VRLLSQEMQEDEIDDFIDDAEEEDISKIDEDDEEEMGDDSEDSKTSTAEKKKGDRMRRSRRVTSGTRVFEIACDFFVDGSKTVVFSGNVLRLCLVCGPRYLTVRLTRRAKLVTTTRRRQVRRVAGARASQPVRASFAHLHARHEDVDDSDGDCLEDGADDGDGDDDDDGDQDAIGSHGGACVHENDVDDEQEVDVHNDDKEDEIDGDDEADDAGDEDDGGGGEEDDAGDGDGGFDEVVLVPMSYLDVGKQRCIPSSTLNQH